MIAAGDECQSSKWGRATACRTKPRQCRPPTRSPSSTACRQRACRSSRCRRSSVRSGFRRWPTPPSVFAGDRAAPGVRYTALVPNLAGLERAHAAGVTEIAIFAAASETFSRRNINQSIDESLAAYRAVCERATALGHARARLRLDGLRLSVRGRRPARAESPWSRGTRRHGRLRGGDQRHDRRRAPRAGAGGRGRCRRHASRSRGSRCTSTTRAAPRSPTF